LDASFIKNEKLVPFKKDTSNLRKATVIDLGSNSVKLVNYHIGIDKSYKPYHVESVRVKLAEGLEDGIIQEKYIDKTIETMKLFRNIVDFEQIDYVICIATSTVRDAKNNIEFLEKIQKESGFKFKILSETQEALYSYVGAIRSLKIPSAIFFDLGGGSLEIVYSSNYEIKTIISLPFGSLRLSQLFKDKKENFSIIDYYKMSEYVVQSLPSREELKLIENQIPVVGVGGTLRTIAKYDQELKNYPLKKIHNYSISNESMNHISQKLMTYNTEETSKIESIGSGRSDTIQAGLCAITELMKKLELSDLVVSAHGLREGTLFVSLQYPDEFFNDAEISLRQIHDVINLSTYTDTLPEHVEDFSHLLSSIMLISDNERILLSHAISQLDVLSSFRDVDNIIYAVMDDDSSLTHREQLIIALSLVYSKKKKKSESLISKYQILLQKNDKKIIKRISSIISLSDIFLKTRTNVTASYKDSILILKIYPKNNSFPEVLFKQACDKLENALDIQVQSTIYYQPSFYAVSKPIGII
jgi:exopolyphosphatase/guanosine-5'-triphosphate,3'-diphosphate pyrophosphatase